MNKKYFMGLIALGALTVTSCFNDEVLDTALQQEAQAIQFSTYLGRDVETKGAVTELNGLKTSGFGVFGYYTKTDDYESTTAANFMFNQAVNFSDGKWDYTPVKYWPNNTNDKLTFLAYAPTTTDTHIELPAGFSNSSTEDAKIKFTVDGTVGSQVDFLVADRQANLQKQTTTGNVKFNFQHALSRIGFTVEAMVDQINDDATGTDDDGTTSSNAIASETSITIESLELSTDFSTNGVINLYTQVWDNLTASATTYSWASADFANTTVTTSKVNLNNTDKYLMILPQTVSNLKFKVVYKVKTLDGALNGGYSEITNTIEETVSSFIFEAGKAYTFNLHLGMTSVKFDAEVSGWSDVTPGTVVNVPINKN